ncbi:DNA-binding GntR family transcriptional regulator [Nocardioides sp. J9]|uniref:GntR family transcriptional regulator n=1 Tax=Nocardioides sp. J9 TaxID=935844 RepID=UPI00119DA52F|nr:GntR family transcriptional regulator [Nocardioides sp. J9]TWG98574.1 DNA-binding GntR family transcriptional regulator [Nocardioides sp. J9]
MAAATSEDSATSPVTVAEKIRDLIVRRELVPGEKIVQLDLANRIGVSRSPLREALSTLEAEGIVKYETNRGYVVARLAAEELAQIYRIRELMETDVLRNLPEATPEALAGLERLNAEMTDALGEGDAAKMLRANREFHFAIFDMSDLGVFRREIRRLWQLSEGYRATYLWLPDARERIVKEHDEIIEAIRQHDLDLVVELSDRHRSASAEVVVNLIAL